MRIMIAAGGTGGHVYPALAVAEALLAKHPATRLYFVGSVDGFERPLIEKSKIRFDHYDEVQAGPISGISKLVAAKNVVLHLIGIVQAVRLLRTHRPQAILSTGGWVSFPVAVAARLLRLPVLIYLPDIEPGLTIKVVTPLATKVAATVPDSSAYIQQKKLIVTGYPLRDAVKKATREDAIAHFGLDPNRKTLLIFGGSRGAQSINTAIAALLPQITARDDVQLLHVTGQLDWERMVHYTGTPNYHAYPYLHDDMGLAFAAADLVVSRAGASTLGELPYFALPSILVPYPYAWRYQKVNADYLASRGAAIRMNDEDMAQELLPSLLHLLDNPAELTRMRAQAARMAKPTAAEAIAEVLVALVNKNRDLLERMQAELAYKASLPEETT